MSSNKFWSLLLLDMAEYTTEDVPPTGDELDPEHIANAFVDQYYLLMEKSPALVHKFYNDKSIIDHPEPNGEMTSAETMQVSIS